MPDIKTREVVRGSIKTLDKGIKTTRAANNTMIKARGAKDNEESGGSPYSYATNTTGNSMCKAAGVAAAKANLVGRRNATATLKNIQEYRGNRGQDNIQTDTSGRVMGTSLM